MHNHSDAAAYVLRFINQTSQSVFLTGQAGTGKTTLLREIIQTTHKNTVVVAPTGIAALNAGGVTIHSMFQLPLATFIPEAAVHGTFHENARIETRDTLRRHFKVSGQKQAVIRNMELLIVDEVSMLRADLLDAMDFMLQSVRKNKTPFGGVQVLFIGDLLQLPPVVKNEEWDVLRKYYRGKFFFNARVVAQHPPIYIELSKIYRQSDDLFISILNNLRNNTITSSDVNTLNRYVKPSFDVESHPGFITLTTHNAKADALNTRALGNLSQRAISFYPEITGEFPEKIFPVDETLTLKEGAQIMFIKNDLSPEKEYYNGKTGRIKSLSPEEILVYFPEEDKTIEVDRYEWRNIRYYVDEVTKEIREEILGTFVHYPIKLAWAITVHKSQGLTFDKAAIDVSNVFAPGQAYVAFSRLRSLNGLILLSPLQINGIASDEEVLRYAQQKADDENLETALQHQTRRYLADTLKDGFTWKDLSQMWRNHAFGYREEGPKSVKHNHSDWAKRNADLMATLLEPSGKFLLQLDRLFAAESLEMDFIAERVDAAYDYFFPFLDKLETEILTKLHEISRLKKAKAFYEELLLLEEMQVKAVRKLLHAKQLAAVVAQGKEICKENLVTDFIRKYRQQKIESVKMAFLAQHAELIEDDAPETRYANPGKKRKKEPKKSTLEETFELWQQQLSIEDIAAQRKLTPQTILSHLSKLIASKQVNIRDVLPEDKVIALARAFVGYTEETLQPLKEKYGDEFTWDELRMFKASLSLR
ncbi:RecBCD enzyme subunit RecD [Flavobacterium longum]|uniref:helix-turn-helix domain-containing protein n=1 Tax=Flavobacterium longum TaxID=1299340 RepID=UPI0039E9943B